MWNWLDIPMLTMGVNPRDTVKMVMFSCGMEHQLNGVLEDRSLYPYLYYQAEIYGLSETIREATWVRRLLTDFGFKVGTIPIYGDNQASILSAHNPSNLQTSKHIDTRKNFNEEKVPKKLVKLECISTTENIADLFTKTLDRNKLAYFRDKLIQLDDSGGINES